MHQRPVGADPSNSATLPAKYYYDEAVYQRKLTDIFFSSWMYAGHDSQLTELSSYFTTEIANQKLFLIRGQDGNVRAFYNVCAHRGHILLQGSGQRAFVTCPYHAWAYALDGALKAVPGTDDMPAFDPSEYGLTQVRAEQIAGFWFVNLNDDAVSLSQTHPRQEEEIRRDVVQLDDLVLREDSEGLATPGDVKCNWKLLVENFEECYHCKPAHKSLCTLFDVQHYQTEIRENYTSANAPTHAIDGVLRNEAYDVTADDPQKVGRFWFIWPNLSITKFPGTPNVSIYRIDPLSPETAGNWT